MSFSFGRLGRTIGVLLIIAGCISFCGRAALAPSPPVSVVPPSGSTTVRLPDGAYLHFLLLPFGRMDGRIVEQATFDHSGRAAFIATFPGATLAGDWRTLDPRLAFVFDFASRTLTALPTVADLRRIAWLPDGRLALRRTDGTQTIVDAGSAAASAAPPLRMSSPDAVTLADVVAQAGDGRFLIARSSAGRYAALQVGAGVNRFEGVAPDGSYALNGGFVVWADRQRSAGVLVSRVGPSSLAPPNFAGAAIGDAVAPVLPLGRSVYQGGYRNGVAYFIFTYGLRRVVAATTDFQAYSFPTIPQEPDITVGDGFGCAADGALYFVRPEEDQAIFWRQGRYVTEKLSFPAGNGDMKPLLDAMDVVASEDPLWPAMRPEEDALDQALLQWRVYPVGDALGDRWIASYLGHVMLGDNRGRFRMVAAPRFPFAVLSRTDDGRLWAAAPLVRTFAAGRLAGVQAALWWSRDAVHWHPAGTFAVDPGAVGLDHDVAWIAGTQPWKGRAEIVLQRLDDSQAAVSGGSYRGEQLFFAQVASGFYLLWGATPGHRQGLGEGTLSAYRIDADALALNASGNIFGEQVLQPSRDPALPPPDFDVHDGAAFLQPSLAELRTPSGPRFATVVTNVADADLSGTEAVVLAPSQLSAYAIEHAGYPYPLITVTAAESADSATVNRALMLSPVEEHGSSERWHRDAAGWHRTAVLNSF